MKFGQKLLIIAKGIGLWWGIYLILGCCVGFALNMAMDLFMILAGVFEIKRYLPLMAVCTLGLAVITYFITEAVKLIPKRILRSKLRKRLDEEGFSDGFVSELLSNAQGDIKNHMLIEAASAYCVRGEILSAEEALHRVDLISVLDIAQSTGKLRTAAYYYCTEMTLCILKSDRDGAAHVYDEGVYYLEAFEDDDRILTVLALYQTAAGLHEAALETLERITWYGLPKKLRRYGLAICAAIAAVNLADLERYDEAKEKAEYAIDGGCSKYVTEFSKGIIERTEKAPKKESAKVKEDEAKETEAVTEEAEVVETTPPEAASPEAAVSEAKPQETNDNSFS